MKYMLKMLLVYTLLFIVSFFSMYADIAPWSVILGFWIGIMYMLVNTKHKTTLKQKS